MVARSKPVQLPVLQGIEHYYQLTNLKINLVVCLQKKRR